MLFEFKKRSSVAHICKSICAVYGKGAVSERICRNGSSGAKMAILATDEVYTTKVTAILNKTIINLYYQVRIID